MASGTVAGVMMFRNQQCHHGCVHQQISNTALCQITELMQHTQLMQMNECLFHHAVYRLLQPLHPASFCIVAELGVKQWQCFASKLEQLWLRKNV